MVLGMLISNLTTITFLIMNSGNGNVQGCHLLEAVAKQCHQCQCSCSTYFLRAIAMHVIIWNALI